MVVNWWISELSLDRGLAVRYVFSNKSYLDVDARKLGQLSIIKWMLSELYKGWKYNHAELSIRGYMMKFDQL